MVLWGIGMNYSCDYAHVLMERNEELKMVFELVYVIYIFLTFSNSCFWWYVHTFFRYR